MSFPLNVQIIQHEEFVAPGEYLRWAERRGCPVSITKCWALDAFPEAGALPDLLVVLGGSQNPGMTEADDPHFFAAAEKELIRRCAEAGRMVVGACLGAQLLGEAMGAPYDHSPERELGPTPLTLTAAGRADPFLTAFPPEFIGGESHNDMPGLTEECAVLAGSAGCPRQIVRYGKYLYGFQTHMEFDREIAAAILSEIPDYAAEPEKHPFVQSAEAVTGYDYREMNALLSSFLERMTAEYLRESRERSDTVAALLEKMLAFSEGNLHDIDHLIRVWAYSRTIGKLEGLDPETQYVLETAAITHDIACPLCREKYGNTNGRHQEEEGAPLVRAFLKGSNLREAELERIAFLVGHHHTFTGVDSLDWQILLEADMLANAGENGWPRERVERFLGRFCKTESGARLIRAVLCQGEAP